MISSTLQYAALITSTGLDSDHELPTNTTKPFAEPNATLQMPLSANMKQSSGHSSYQQTNRRQSRGARCEVVANSTNGKTTGRYYDPEKPKPHENECVEQRHDSMDVPYYAGMSTLVTWQDVIKLRPSEQIYRTTFSSGFVRRRPQNITPLVRCSYRKSALRNPPWPYPKSNHTSSKAIVHQ